MTRRREIASFAAFWPVYLREHRCPRCRALHYAAAAAGVTVAAVAVARAQWWLLAAAPAVAYALAWLGHFVFERNQPATWVHPLWSLRAEWRMVRLALSGRLREHLDAAGASRRE